MTTEARRRWRRGEAVPVLPDGAVQKLPAPAKTHYLNLRASYVDRLLPNECELCRQIAEALPDDNERTS